MDDSLQVVADEVECPPLFAIWKKAINVGLCEDFFSGFFAIWITHFVTATLFFFVLIAASGYFNRHRFDLEVVTGFDGSIQDTKVKYNKAERDEMQPIQIAND
jgi:hypothetical protein